MGYNDTMGGRDLGELPKDDGFEPVPDGWYDVVIAEAQDKETKARNGGYLNFKVEIEGPSHAGRVIWSMCLYQHTNEKAEKIGLSRLHNLARAMGRNALPKDLVSFSGVRVQAKVKVKAAQGNFEAGNEIVDFKAMDRSGAPAAKGPPAAVRHPAPAGFEDKPMFDGDDDIPI
jgi:hypothetical protein